MSKISMFGVSSSGKTCFLYAMARVLRSGIRHEGELVVEMISNRFSQQRMLDEGYLELASRKWPDKSNETIPFDFKVRMRCNGHFGDVIDSLEILDYRGGILEDMSKNAEKNLKDLMDSFRGSSAIIFIIDGKTLIDAMENDDKDVIHRGDVDVLNHISARMQIEFVENIFMEYKRVEKDIPPVLVAISKGDLLASDYERENGIRFIREKLPSIFSIGSGLWSGITIMSLGENLGSDENGVLTGKLKLTLDYKIHIPIIFGIYADLSYTYEESDDQNDKDVILKMLKVLRKIMSGKVQIFKSGKIARES